MEVADKSRIRCQGTLLSLFLYLFPNLHMYHPSDIPINALLLNRFIRVLKSLKKVAEVVRSKHQSLCVDLIEEEARFNWKVFSENWEDELNETLKHWMEGQFESYPFFKLSIESLNVQLGIAYILWYVTLINFHRFVFLFLCCMYLYFRQDSDDLSSGVSWKKRQHLTGRFLSTLITLSPVSSFRKQHLITG